MSSAKGIRQVAYVDTGGGGGAVRRARAANTGFERLAWHDCAGGGQIIVDGGIAYVGNMRNPHGTLIIDVSDPKRPKQLAEIGMPPGTHSHKVRVANGIMLTNREVLGERVRRGESPPDDFQGGLGIYDVSTPAKPKLITLWKTTDQPGPGYARGVHRFDFDGRYACISPTWDGYVGNIVMILDLKDPARPEEVGRWWMPGQWTAGGEKPTWKGAAHKCHHPLRCGNRLYTSYWHGGFVILDIEDMTRPTLVSHVDWSPPFPWPTHTCLRIPFKIDNRDFMVVSDEDVVRLEGCPPYPSAFLWIVDITDEQHPMPIATYQLDHIPPEEQPYMTGCHQPCEKVTGTEIPVAWFAHGLRIIDIARPHAPKEVAHFLPDPPPGSPRVQSNDVMVDDRGLIYLLDRVRGLHILERA
ncbi:MAG: LVIVD repeat-containing protein [Betaproteobacteria bacterium]